MTFPHDLQMCQEKRGFELWIDQVVSRKWVVYAKRPFAGPEKVLAYLSQYTHRSAISNRRILSIEEGQVEFSYKDYTDKQQLHKTMKLSGHDFIQRFFFHVLPAGFVSSFCQIDLSWLCFSRGLERKQQSIFRIENKKRRYFTLL